MDELKEGGGLSDGNGGYGDADDNDESNKLYNSHINLKQSQELRANIKTISDMLNTGLSSESLDACMSLLEAGVPPQALVDIIIQIRREFAGLAEAEDK